MAEVRFATVGDGERERELFMGQSPGTLPCLRAE